MTVKLSDCRQQHALSLNVIRFPVSVISGPIPGVVNPELSSIEVENLLRAQVKSNYSKLLQVLLQEV